jgi:CheY-like chemotaxis protein
VGAGLVQLAALPDGLSSLGDFLGDGLEIPNGSAVAVATVLYGLGIGFLFFYLWARLRLRVLLESSEREAEQQSRREKIEAGLTEAAVRSATAESTAAIARAADEAASIAVSRPGRTLSSVLWVDDHPENNAALASALREAGASVRLARSTRECLQLLERGRYGLIITDLGRVEDGRERSDAGLELIRQLRERGDTTTIFVFAGARGYARREELIAAGADRVANSSTELFSAAVEVLAIQP